MYFSVFLDQSLPGLSETGRYYSIIKLPSICMVVQGFLFFSLLISVLTVGIFLPLAQLICFSGGLLTRNKKGETCSRGICKASSCPINIQKCLACYYQKCHY